MFSRMMLHLNTNIIKLFSYIRPLMFKMKLSWNANSSYSITHHGKRVYRCQHQHRHQPIWLGIKQFICLQISTSLTWRKHKSNGIKQWNSNSNSDHDNLFINGENRMQIFLYLIWLRFSVVVLCLFFSSLFVILALNKVKVGQKCHWDYEYFLQRRRRNDESET